ncbi:MAG: hypothetical protein AB1428_12940 [Bacteroidota bacterium]
MHKTFAFRIDSRVAELIEADARAQFSDESAILRQIVHKHYGIAASEPTASRRRRKQDTKPNPIGAE